MVLDTHAPSATIMAMHAVMETDFHAGCGGILVRRSPGMRVCCLCGTPEPRPRVRVRLPDGSTAWLTLRELIEADRGVA